MKKSVKLRGLKLAASVLCVLAAGLCYSCGQKPEDTVLLLASQDAAPAEPETAESAERLPDETAAEPLPGTEPETGPGGAGSGDHHRFAGRRLYPGDGNLLCHAVCYGRRCPSHGVGDR